MQAKRTAAGSRRRWRACGNAAKRKGVAFPVRFQDTEIDVGLLDVIVSFRIMPGNKLVLSSTEEERNKLRFVKTLSTLTSVCGDALHDQMIMAMAIPHIYRSDGELLFHIHNLIFGLRQEVRGDMDILGPLDLEPVMKVLSRSGGLDFIGGVKR